MTKSPILPTIHSPDELRQLSLPQLERLAAEMREVLCGLIACRSAHFASNLGVVELCLALHQAFDFRREEQPGVPSRHVASRSAAAAR